MLFLYISCKLIAWERKKGDVRVEHFITQINIKELLHLSNIQINLNEEKRQHLLITGKNGSGKTSLLLAIQKYIKAINDGRLSEILKEYPDIIKITQDKLKRARSESERYEWQKKYESFLSVVKRYSDGVETVFNYFENLDSLYEKGDFVTAFFPADRKTKLQHVNGVEEVKLAEKYSVDADPGSVLLKYMVHLKTQQSYARNEGDTVNAERIQKWFDRFEDALRILLDDSTIRLEFDYRQYNFMIHQQGKKPFSLEQLSDGYSSVIYMLADLILRMDKNWLLGDKLSRYDTEGVVLIDELETHLHIELQKKILPFLTEFFPRIQFIVTTHSPYILNSISNAKAYDLEKQRELENLSAFSSEELAEAYFDADEYSEDIKRKLSQYEYLKRKKELTDDERAERARLRSELKNLSGEFSGAIKDKFEELERKE